jgi:hypothetical protein
MVEGKPKTNTKGDNMTKNAPDTERDFTPAEIVRIHEANCQIDFAAADEQNFRIAIMKHIGRRLGLAELRGMALTGPGTGVARPRLEK